MPIIAKFYGIIIKMYFINSEHNPPHIHAFYNDYVAAIRIEDFVVIAGELPTKAKEMVIEWMKIHKNELLDMWNNQKFTRISGLE